MKQIRNNVFETNSPSTHSICIATGSDKDLTDLPTLKNGTLTLYTGEYGWEQDTYSHVSDRLSYATTFAMNSFSDYKDGKYIYDEDNEYMLMLKKVIIEMTGATEIKVDSDSLYHEYEYEYGYIDHQSWDDASEIFESEETLKQFLFNPQSYFETDNDKSLKIMKRQMRQNVFETNSSSTSSLCIKPTDWYTYGIDRDFNEPYIPIEVKTMLGYTTKTAIIKTSNYYKRGGGYFLIENSLNKIQFIASSLSEFSDIFSTDLKPEQLTRFQSIYTSIKEYLKKEYDISYVEIEIVKSYRDGTFIQDLIGWWWEKDIKLPFDESEIIKIVDKVISDDNIVFICHSDESGPFPDDIGLIKIENLKDLLNEKTNS